MQESDYWKPLTDELYKLKQPEPGEEPLPPKLVAQRAELRRGVGKRWPTRVMGFVHQSMHRLSERDEEIAYLIASLFALHPSVGDGVSIGGALRQWRETQRLRDGMESDAAERRLVNLLNSSKEDLPTKLRQVISLLRSNGIPIDWRLLLDNLRKWDSFYRTVQRQWAKDFWGRSKTDPDATTTDERDSDLSSETLGQEN